MGNLYTITPFTTVSVDTTLTSVNSVVEVDVASKTITLTEPSSDLKGKEFTVINSSGGDIFVDVDGTSTTIDGVDGTVIISDGYRMRVICNGLKGYLTIFNIVNTVSGMSDYSLAIAEGSVTGYSSVNKFGRTLNADLNVNTDIWDGANATDDIDVWVAPTTARIHDIVSTSTSDTSGGAGAKTIEVYGLTGWGTAEVSETITMNGTSNVATSNSYVIIHRMKVLTKGATDINVGQITATAQTDATVTAMILASEGQTQMAIYGIPSTQTAFLTGWYASTNGSTNIDADMELLFNPEPDVELTNFQIKETQSVRGGGSNYIQRFYNPYNSFTGPGIIKIQTISDTNNSDISAGFDLILKDN